MPKALLCVKSLATVTVAARCPSPMRPLAPLAAPPAPTTETGSLFPHTRNKQDARTHTTTPPHILVERVPYPDKRI
ncbi:hypothetical protein EV715DRAFT_247670, partial [Schizophyllum commune]